MPLCYNVSILDRCFTSTIYLLLWLKIPFKRINSFPRTTSRYKNEYCYNC